MITIYMNKDEFGRTYYSEYQSGAVAWYNLDVMLCRMGLNARQVNLVDVTGGGAWA